MKLLTCFVMIILFYLSSYAQQNTTDKILYKDTINLSGYIYYDNGKPAVAANISSINKDLKYDRFILSTYTDSTGFFRLQGAKHQDTLSVSSMNFWGKYPNRGARYMVIIVPNPILRELTLQKLQVIAIRKSPKQKQQFNIQPYTEPKPNLNEGFIDGEQIPEHPGGDRKFYTYVQGLLKYPQKAVDANIEGVVEIKFTVKRNGDFDNFKLLKGIGYGCDEAVINILKQCPRWYPGKIHGTSIDVDHTLSIEFKLTDK